MPGSRLREEQFRRLVQDAPAIIAVVEADSFVRYVSRSVGRTLGLPPEEVVGSRLSDYLHPEEFGQTLDALVGGSDGPGGSPTTVEVRMRHADGSWRHFEATAVNRLNEPSVNGVVVYMHDITQRKSLEDDLLRRAFHDPLTGLANRDLFLDRLEHALARIARMEEPIAVLFVDIDNFKAINDDFGHEAGDRLLVTVSQRLHACLRPGETVARMGGDEFAILLEGSTDTGSVTKRIVEALGAPVAWDGRLLCVTASVGVASSDDGLNRAEDLLRAADRAMYRAKKRGKKRSSVILEMRTDTEELERLELKNSDLRRAMEREELEVYYQPEVSLRTREIVGVEALLRWEHPKLGMVPSAELTATAEENGLILPIGQWVLEEACSRAFAWQEQYPDAPLPVTVKLSVGQFRHPALAETVATILRETGLEPPRLVLELAESVLVEDVEHTTNSFRRLKDLGVRLAVDGFGIDLSSLSHFGLLPVDFLKIDRSLVEKLGKDERKSVLLVSLLVGFAQTLGIEAAAEGVRDARQLEDLRGMECDLAQGPYFSEPLPDYAVTELMRGRSGELTKLSGRVTRTGRL